MSSMGYITTGGHVETGPEKQRREELDAARRRWHEIKPNDLEQVGVRLFADKASGNLYEPVLGTVLHGKFQQNPAADRASFFTVNSDNSLTFFQKPEGGPQTLGELNAERAEAQRAQDQHEARHRDFIASQPMRPLTLNELERNAELPTIRAAAAAVLEHGGKLEAQDGNLIVLLPERFAEDGWGDLGARNMVYPAVRVLLAAKDVILAELAGSKKPLNPDRLPDKHALVAGGVEP